MPIGKIVDAPTDTSAYSRIRDEHGEEHTVHSSELPSGAEDGDQFAYLVDIWQYEDGDVATLRNDIYSPK